MQQDLTPQPNGASAPTEGRGFRNSKELADWVMALYTAIWGQDAMFRRYPDELTLAMGRGAFIRALGGMTAQQLKHGQKMLERDPGDWPKPPGEFAKLCVRAPEHAFHVKQIEHKAEKETALRWIAQMKSKLSQKIE